MPRCARIKSSDSIYHIMVRSIDDTLLFRDDFDKDNYLEIVKKYQDIYSYRIYSYCIMDNHAHFIMDTAGADISDIMHGVNQSYAQKFNKRHHRRGHLFWDRFKSKIIRDEKYLITLSGYIHKNPLELKDYSDNIENYKYSSLGLFLGLREDNLALVDKNFVLQLFSKFNIKAAVNYLNFVGLSDMEKLGEEMEFKNEKAEYRSERKILIRDLDPIEVVEYVSEYTKQGSENVKIKYVKKVREFKALSALLLRGLCNMKQREIAKFLGNITQPYASRLCLEGFNLIQEKPEFRNIITKFVEVYSI